MTVSSNDEKGTIIEATRNIPVYDYSAYRQNNIVGTILQGGVFILDENMGMSHNDVRIISPSISLDYRYFFIYKSDLLDHHNIIHKPRINKRELHSKIRDERNREFVVVHDFRSLEIGETVVGETLWNRMNEPVTDVYSGTNILLFVDILSDEDKKENKGTKEINKEDVSVDDLDKVVIKDGKLFKE